MRLVRLQLESFRSYAAAELVPDPGLTLIAGPNGAGKTNLLESIWVAVSGRSHRATTDAELVARGAAFARVALEVADGEADPDRIEVVLPGADPPPGLRRRLTVNGVARRQASMAETARAQSDLSSAWVCELNRSEQDDLARELVKLLQSETLQERPGASAAQPA